jgi:hypothetical protein
MYVYLSATGYYRCPCMYIKFFFVKKKFSFALALSSPAKHAPAYRVARWFVLKTKNPNLDEFWRVYTGRRWNVLWTLGPFYGLLLYFVDIWYGSW